MNSGAYTDPKFGAADDYAQGTYLPHSDYYNQQIQEIIKSNNSLVLNFVLEFPNKKRISYLLNDIINKYFFIQIKFKKSQIQFPSP